VHQFDSDGHNPDRTLQKQEEPKGAIT
jgi:hypothetical protein